MGRFFVDWKKQRVVLLRKGNKPLGDASSYRPICLLDTMGELLEELILQQLQTLLFGELATWLNRKHGEVGFYLAQVLSGHGCFNAYLRRFKKRDEEMCCYCDSSLDNAEHALFVCAKWGAARVVVGQAVRAHLTPDTMVSLMLQSVQIWTLIESLLTLVMKTRELDGRWEKNNGKGQ